MALRGDSDNGADDNGSKEGGSKESSGDNTRSLGKGNRESRENSGRDGDNNKGTISSRN